MSIYLRALNFLFRPVLDLVMLLPLLHLFIGEDLNEAYSAYLVFSVGYILLSIAVKSNIDSWRHISLESFSRSLFVGICSTGSLYAYSLTGVNQTMRFVSIMTLVILGSRILRREFARSRDEKLPRTLILGSERKHVSLAAYVNSYSHNVIGYVDPRGQMVNKGNFKVLGSIENIEKLLLEYEIEEVIVLDSNYFNESHSVKKACKAFNIKLSKANLFAGNKFKLNKKSLDALLGRDPIEVCLKNQAKRMESKNVYITGAGGSIGSEIVRQVRKMRVKNLVLIDHSEINLFNIINELKIDKDGEVNIIPKLVNVADYEALDECFKEVKPDYIFHAAAYKHVHLVEMNPCAAIVNNVLGTKNLLSLSEEYKVSNFMLISTDKAVNPTSVMGATKRLCEVLVAYYSSITPEEQEYRSVRFGNVLGSSGSLIPILTEQILNNEDITITDSRMMRYFMTIPEAVGLVLKSIEVSAPGSLCVLKMGEPIRIMDIAKRLISLIGKKESDVNIIFTGMKKGEKLFEELYLTGNEDQTSHSDIVTIKNADCGELLQNELTRSQLMRRISIIVEKADRGDLSCLDDMTNLINNTNRSLDSTNEFVVHLGQVG